MVDEDPEALEEMVEKTGKRATPVTLIGDEVVVGFDRRKLEKVLGIGKRKEKVQMKEKKEKDKKKKFGWLGSIFSGLMSSA